MTHSWATHFRSEICTRVFKVEKKKTLLKEMASKAFSIIKLIVAHLLRIVKKICVNVCFYLAGISGKSQILFALVFTTRYLDLFTSFISVYNTTMKIFFIISSYATIYLMYVHFKATYDSNHDTFRVEFLVVPVGGLAFLVNHEFSPLEVGTWYSKLCN